MDDHQDSDLDAYGGSLLEKSTASFKPKFSLGFDMRRETDTRRIQKQRPLSSPLNRFDTSSSTSSLVIDSSKKLLTSKMSNNKLSFNKSQDSFDYYQNNVNAELTVASVITEQNSMLKTNHQRAYSANEMKKRRPQNSKVTLPYLCVDLENNGAKYITQAENVVMDTARDDDGQELKKNTKRNKNISSVTALSETDKNTLALGKIVLHTVLSNPNLKTTESLSQHFFDAWLAKNNKDYLTSSPNPKEEAAKTAQKHNKASKLHKSLSKTKAANAAVAALAAQQYNKVMSAVAMEAMDVLIEEAARDGASHNSYFPLLQEIRSALLPLLFVESLPNVAESGVVTPGGALERQLSDGIASLAAEPQTDLLSISSAPQGTGRERVGLPDIQTDFVTDVNGSDPKQQGFSHSNSYMSATGSFSSEMMSPTTPGPQLHAGPMALRAPSLSNLQSAELLEHSIAMDYAELVETTLSRPVETAAESADFTQVQRPPHLGLRFNDSVSYSQLQGPSVVSYSSASIPISGEKYLSLHTYCEELSVLQLQHTALEQKLTREATVHQSLLDKYLQVEEESLRSAAGLRSLTVEYERLAKDYKELRSINESQKRALSESKSLCELEKSHHATFKLLSEKLGAEARESDILLNNLEKRYSVLEVFNESLKSKLEASQREVADCNQRIKDTHSHYNARDIQLSNTVKQQELHLYSYTQFYKELTEKLAVIAAFVQEEDRSDRTEALQGTIALQHSAFVTASEAAQKALESTAAAVDDHDRVVAYHEVIRNFAAYADSVAINSINQNNVLQRENLQLQADLARLDAESKAYVEKLLQTHSVEKRVMTTSFEEVQKNLASRIRTKDGEIEVLSADLAQTQATLQDTQERLQEALVTIEHNNAAHRQQVAHLEDQLGMFASDSMKTKLLARFRKTERRHLVTIESLQIDVHNLKKNVAEARATISDLQFKMESNEKAAMQKEMRIKNNFIAEKATLKRDSDAALAALNAELSKTKQTVAEKELMLSELIQNITALNQDRSSLVSNNNVLNVCLTVSERMLMSNQDVNYFYPREERPPPADPEAQEESLRSEVLQCLEDMLSSLNNNITVKPVEEHLSGTDRNDSFDMTRSHTRSWDSSAASDSNFSQSDTSSAIGSPSAPRGKKHKSRKLSKQPSLPAIGMLRVKQLNQRTSINTQPSSSESDSDEDSAPSDSEPPVVLKTKGHKPAMLKKGPMVAPPMKRKNTFYDVNYKPVETRKVTQGQWDLFAERLLEEKRKIQYLSTSLKVEKNRVAAEFLKFSQLFDLMKQQMESHIKGQITGLFNHTFSESIVNEMQRRSSIASTGSGGTSGGGGERDRSVIAKAMQHIADSELIKISRLVSQFEGEDFEDDDMSGIAESVVQRTSVSFALGDGDQYEGKAAGDSLRRKTLMDNELVNTRMEKKNRLRRLSMGHTSLHISTQTPEVFPGHPDYVDSADFMAGNTTDSSPPRIGRVNSAGILTKRHQQGGVAKKAKTFVDLSAEAAQNRVSPHMLSQPFIGYIRRHEKLLGREVGIMKVAVREFKGLYDAIAEKITRMLNTKPDLPGSVTATPQQSNVLSNSRPDTSSVSAALYGGLVSQLQEMKQVVDDSLWMFDPASFVHKVSANPLQNPIDVAAQSRLLDSYLLAHQDSLSTQTREVQSAMRDLVTDLQVRRESSGGWRAMMYRCDGTVDLEMDLSQWNSPDQIAILAEQLSYVKGKLAQQEKSTAAEVQALQTELATVKADSHQTLSYHTHHDSLGADSGHESDHQSVGSGRSGRKHMPHRSTTGDFHGSSRSTGRGSSSRHSVAGSPPRKAHHSAPSVSHVSVQKDDTNLSDSALRIAQLESALSVAHNTMDAITAALGHIQQKQERDKVISSEVTANGGRVGKRNRAVGELVSPSLVAGDDVDNDHLTQASREILEDYSFSISNKRPLTAVPHHSSGRPSGLNTDVSKFVKNRGAPISLSASGASQESRDFVPLGSNGSYVSSQRDRLDNRPQSAAVTSLKRRSVTGVYNSHSGSGDDPALLAHKTLNFPQRTGGKSFLDRNTHEGWRQLEALRREQRGLSIVHAHDNHNNGELRGDSVFSGAANKGPVSSEPEGLRKMSVVEIGLADGPIHNPAAGVSKGNNNDLWLDSHANSVYEENSEWAATGDPLLRGAAAAVGLYGMTDSIFTSYSNTSAVLETGLPVSLSPALDQTLTSLGARADEALVDGVLLACEKLCHLVCQLPGYAGDLENLNIRPAAAIVNPRKVSTARGSVVGGRRHSAMYDHLIAKVEHESANKAQSDVASYLQLMQSKHSRHIAEAKKLESAISAVGNSIPEYESVDEDRRLSQIQEQIKTYYANKLTLPVTGSDV